jgi:hypothetical protein
MHLEDERRDEARPGAVGPTAGGSAAPARFLASRQGRARPLQPLVSPTGSILGTAKAIGADLADMHSHCRSERLIAAMP